MKHIKTYEKRRYWEYKVGDVVKLHLDRVKDLFFQITERDMEYPRGPLDRSPYIMKCINPTNPQYQQITPGLDIRPNLEIIYSPYTEEDIQLVKLYLSSIKYNL
jgi:hypothetical protein